MVWNNMEAWAVRCCACLPVLVNCSRLFAPGSGRVQWPVGDVKKDTGSSARQCQSAESAICHEDLGHKPGAYR